MQVALTTTKNATLTRTATCLGKLFTSLFNAQGVRGLSRHSPRELAHQGQAPLAHLVGQTTFTDEHTDFCDELGSLLLAKILHANARLRREVIIGKAQAVPANASRLPHQKLRENSAIPSPFEFLYSLKLLELQRF